jgi:superfamily II DNA or RNA helicase
MPKAVISNRIYLDNPGVEKTKEIISALTYKFKKDTGSKQFAPVETVKNYKTLVNGILSIPQARTDLIPEGYEILDKRTYVPVPFPDPKFALRDSQLPVYNDATDTCFINALVGWGKSITALYLAYKFGQKTLVVTHTAALRDQWKEEVQALFGMPAGTIGGGVLDYEDHAITIANVQTLVKHADRLSSEFGTIIVDECLDYESLVRTEEYGTQKIGVIVNSKKPCKVLSVCPVTGVASYKQVVSYYKNKHTDCLKISHSGGGSLKCTPNHGIYVYVDGAIHKIPAEYLDVGDLIVQDTVGHKSTFILNKEWQQIALGLILGDGSLSYGNKRSDSVRIKITHGQAQFDYLDWKATLMGSTTECIGKSGYKPENKIKGVISKSFYDVDDWVGQLYVDGHKRTITKNISELMDVRSWALLYQDDGSLNAGGITFSVCELDESSVSNLQNSLAKLFDVLDSEQYICNKGYRYLRLKTVSSKKFLQGINGLVHPQLMYKMALLPEEELKPFNFPVPEVPFFNEDMAVRKVISIENSTLTGGYRYNIEVEDNHTYFANGILVSNCHHVPSTTFTESLDKLKARYRIGLSGTLQRKDGKHIMFKDHFGDNIIQPPQSNTLTPRVRIVKTGITLKPGATWVEKITELANDDGYQRVVAATALRQIEHGHQVLVIADRVEFLKKVANYVGETCVLVTGETDFEARQSAKQQLLSREKMCIAGSRQIFSEGISINSLSCVILAVPMSNDALLEQIIGRVQRLHEGKLDPLVIDMNFQGWADKKQNNDRLGFYLRKGWHVETV